MSGHVRANQGVSGRVRANQGVSGHVRACQGMPGRVSACQGMPGPPRGRLTAEALPDILACPQPKDLARPDRAVLHGPFLPDLPRCRRERRRRLVAKQVRGATTESGWGAGAGAGPGWGPRLGVGVGSGAGTGVGARVGVGGWGPQPPASLPLLALPLLSTPYSPARNLSRPSSPALFPHHPLHPPSTTALNHSHLLSPSGAPSARRCSTRSTRAATTSTTFWPSL